MDGFAGDISFNEEEVIEVKYMTVEDIRADMQHNPDAYTQWFREELASLNYFQTA
jgi:isopentenyldiphosphate isomerase